MPIHLEVAALSLLAATVWGAGDFSGGIAARKADVFGVVLFAHATGLAAMIALALLLHEPPLSRHEFLFSAAAGLSNGIALVSLYRALAVGKMGVTAPVAAVLTAVLPVLFTVHRDGWPKPIQAAGFVLAFIAIWLIAKPEGDQGTPRGVGLAVLAGLGFSGFLVLIRYAGSNSVFSPLAVARSASLLMVIGLVLARRGPWKPQRGTIPIACSAGFLDAFGTTFFLLAAQRGRLDVAAVLSSLYPASTVILARLLLKERLSPLQQAGMLSALIAVPMIAAR
jgi:drug/metabolite transporter (DMT)-like permease